MAVLLARAAAGHPPAPDGGLTIVPQPNPRDLGVLAFTGHVVIFADLDHGWIRGLLPGDDVAAPLNPPFLRALEEQTGRLVDSVDLLTCADPLDGAPPTALTEITGAGHARVARAHRHRDEVRVWRSADGLVILGRGVAGRWEAAVEVEPAHRGRGAGRLLARAARHLSPGPVWAQIAPGNAASVRAFLAAGYLPVAAEALLPANS
ncbi:GNAT family N-acetyltransferase [Nonomuraea sp. NN258]|nr:GNAT family N-acetyltransferase [Nonomuraea antri]